MFQPLVPCLSSLVGSAYPNSICLDPYGSAVWRTRTPLSREKEDRGGNDTTTKNKQVLSQKRIKKLQHVSFQIHFDGILLNMHNLCRAAWLRRSALKCFFYERPFNKAGRCRKTLWIDPHIWKRDCLLSCWESDEWADDSWCNSEDGVTKVGPLASISLELREKNLLLGD